MPMHAHTRTDKAQPNITICKYPTNICGLAKQHWSILKHAACPAQKGLRIGRKSLDQGNQQGRRRCQQTLEVNTRYGEEDDNKKLDAQRTSQQDGKNSNKATTTSPKKEN